MMQAADTKKYFYVPKAGKMMVPGSLVICVVFLGQGKMLAKRSKNLLASHGIHAE